MKSVIKILCVENLLLCFWEKNLNNIEFWVIIYPVSKYTETCLNGTFLEPTFVIGMDRCLVCTGKLDKDYLHVRLCFIQHLV